MTPPDKNNRRAGALDRQLVNPGTPSAGGQEILFRLANGILDPTAGTTFPHATEYVVLRREADRWATVAINDLASVVPAGDAPVANPLAVSGDFGVQAWEHNKQLFESGSRLSTKIMGDTGGLAGSGWYDWLVDPVISARVFTVTDEGLVDDAGDRMVRWFDRYRGLLGASDPSLGQLAPTGCSAVTHTCSDYPGGSAIYLQEPPGTGPRHLVNGCTSAGGPTEIPARLGSGDPTDTIGAQSCGLGTPTSVRGAAIGSGTANATSVTARAMSANGKRVFFTSPDPAVAPAACSPATGGATSCPPQLFVRQYDSSAPGATGAARVRWISRSEVAGQSIGLLRDAIYEGASSDGRYVFFRTDAPLTSDDPNGGESIAAGPASPESWDLYRYELPASVDADPAAGDLTRITGGPGHDADPSTNAKGEGTAVRYVSDDGEQTYFVTNAPLDGADATPPNGGITTPEGTATNATTRNLYLHDETEAGAAAYRFIASLPFAPTNATNSVDACASAYAGSGPTQQTLLDATLSRRVAGCVRGTPDGDAIAFETTGQLTADDDDTASDVYLYDAAADELVRVSRPPAGATPYGCNVTPATSCNGDFGVAGPLGDGQIGLAGGLHANLATDDAGEVSVLFESRLALVSDDVNGSHMDTYRWHDGELSLISPGDTTDDAWYSGNDADGKNVFFFTTQRIDPREIEDADFDLYDARVGGGFPYTPPPPACDVLGHSCRPGAGASPAPQELGSAQPGEQNFRALLSVKQLTRGQRNRLARHGRVTVRVVVRAAGRVAVRAKRGRRVVARGAKTVAGPGTASVRLRLDRRTRRALARRPRLRLALDVRFAGQRQTLSLELRRPK